MTLDLPLPLGPTTEEKHCHKEPYHQKLSGDLTMLTLELGWLLQKKHHYIVVLAAHKQTFEKYQGILWLAT